MGQRLKGSPSGKYAKLPLIVIDTPAWRALSISAQALFPWLLMEFKGKLVHKRQDTIIVAQMQIVQEVLAQNNPEIWLDIKQKMQERLQ